MFQQQQKGVYYKPTKVHWLCLQRYIIKKYKPRTANLYVTSVILNTCSLVVLIVKDMILCV